MMQYSRYVWARSIMTVLVVGTLMSSANGLAALCAFDPPMRCDDEEDDIEDQMEKVHKGRRSPYQLLRQSLALDKPDWNVVLRQVPQMEVMARMLHQTKNDAIRDSSEGYAAAVQDIVRHAQAHDLHKTRKALVSLGNSCGDCHFKGGVGGRLDD